MYTPPGTAGAGMTHGTRQMYQRAGCHCLPCRAAEAGYRAALRRLHVLGKLPLGATIPARDTWHRFANSARNT
jgi:hypothetical protein